MHPVPNVDHANTAGHIHTTLPQIKRIYQEVIFETLVEKDYGFKAVFLNPAGATRQALELLEYGYQFPCAIFIHHRVWPRSL